MEMNNLEFKNYDLKITSFVILICENVHSE